MKFVSNYFDSEWSFASHKIPDTKETKIAFHPDSNTIVILSMEGNFYMINFDPSNPGQCLPRITDKITPVLEGNPFLSLPTGSSPDKPNKEVS